MVDSKPNFKSYTNFHFLLLFLFIVHFSHTNSLLADDFKLSSIQQKKVDETFKFIDKLEPKKLKIDKSTYQKFSKFEDYYKFHFSGKKLSKWIRSRIQKFSFGETGDFIALYQDEEVFLGKIFFTLSPLERTLVLIHEARHADGKQFAHVVCPDSFEFLNPRDWKIFPAGKKGCDSLPEGSYGVTAAFLFELGAYGFISQTEAGLRYNSEISRVVRRKD